MATRSNQTRNRLVIYTAAGAAAFSAIAYELLLASYATFLLGATVFQYSLVVSFMMASMGVGSLIVHLLTKKNPHRLFFFLEMGLAWVALLAVPALYYVFATQAGTRPLLLFFVGMTGMGIGMEIPLLNSLESNAGVSRILFFDYLGGFIGGIAFPLLLLPHLGFFRVSGVLSLLSAAVGLAFLWRFSGEFKAKRASYLVLGGLTVLAALVFTVFAESIRHSMEFKLFGIQDMQ